MHSASRGDGENGWFAGSVFAWKAEIVSPHIKMNLTLNALYSHSRHPPFLLPALLNVAIQRCRVAPSPRIVSVESARVCKVTHTSEP